MSLLHPGISLFAAIQARWAQRESWSRCSHPPKSLRRSREVFSYGLVDVRVAYPRMTASRASTCNNPLKNRQLHLPWVQDLELRQEECRQNPRSVLFG